MKEIISRHGWARISHRARLMMVSVMGGAALLAPFLGQAGSPARSPGAPRVLSKRASESFQTKLVLLSNSARSSRKPLKSVVITDDEINSYLKYDKPPDFPPSVTNTEIHFKPDGIYGKANVNFDQLKPAQQPGDALGAKLLSAIFHGNQLVTAVGKVDSSDGTGRLTIADVHIGSTALSDWLVNWLIQTYVQKQYNVDLSKPFLLPDHVARVDLAPGQMIFVRSAQKKNSQ